jgi:hypothetical protein
MIDEGLDEAKERRVEILPTDRVAWCVAPESTTQSCTEVGGGWSAMVLKELASDCWSQPTPSQGFHPGAAGAAGTTAAVTAAVARTGGQETRRGPVWP